jgi:hypothetical protein
VCSADDFVERRAIACDSIERDKTIDGPAVFARIDVLIDSRNAELAPLSVTQREIICTVLAVDEVGILAGIESASGRGEKCAEIAADSCAA